MRILSLPSVVEKSLNGHRGLKDIHGPVVSWACDVTLGVWRPARLESLEPSRRSMKRWNTKKWGPGAKTEAETEETSAWHPTAVYVVSALIPNECQFISCFVVISVTFGGHVSNVSLFNLCVSFGNSSEGFSSEKKTKKKKKINEICMKKRSSSEFR